MLEAPARFVFRRAFDGAAADACPFRIKNIRCSPPTPHYACHTPTHVIFLTPRCVPALFEDYYEIAENAV